jgi:plasmid stabilization system protein ParE
MASELVRKCDEIADGFNHGHRRFDVDGSLPYRFLTVSPLVIVYNPHTRQVVRILDGRRDFSRLFR